MVPQFGVRSRSIRKPHALHVTHVRLRKPTALDALVFAYLHCLIHSPDSVRLDVAGRTNLVLWERRVRELVKSAFVS